MPASLVNKRNGSTVRSCLFNAKSYKKSQYEMQRPLDMKCSMLYTELFHIPDSTLFLQRPVANNIRHTLNYTSAGQVPLGTEDKSNLITTREFMRYKCLRELTIVRKQYMLCVRSTPFPRLVRYACLKKRCHCSLCT